MKKKYNITADKRGHFYFNGKRCTAEWHNHFSGLTMEQEGRCTQLFIRYYLRRHPEAKV